MKHYVNNSTKGWWRVYFRIKWQKDKAPSWYIDLILAHKIISPVLEKYEDNLIFWRFHRRAIQDNAGHQFSFIFYTLPEIGDQIIDTVKSNKLLKEMEKDGLIVEWDFEEPNMTTQFNIEDTSDPKWSPLIKKSWPYFIMGVSKMWLTLIDQIAKEFSNKQKHLTLLQIYQKVNEEIKQLWREQGHHSLLHHLNAIFGYEPIIIYEQRLMRF